MAAVFAVFAVFAVDLIKASPSRNVHNHHFTPPPDKSLPEVLLHCVLDADDVCYESHRQTGSAGAVATKPKCKL